MPERPRKNAAPRILLWIAGILLLALLCLRIYAVNSHDYTYPIEHHPVGEWVDLSGTFFYDKALEHLDGYSICVQDARIVSYNEYIALYGLDPAQQVDSPTYDEPGIVCVTMVLKNEGNSDGMFSMLDAKLYPQGGITGYQADGSLWSTSNPNFDDTFFYIGVLPDTEVVLHVPFPVPTTAATFDMKYQLPVTESDFEFVLSIAPVRHVIDIHL